jgi:NAD(P)-dependent dehydrogenase (short-subunit alcohol dehydrogenase family)
MQRANTTDSLRSQFSNISTLNLNKAPRPGIERAPTSTNLARPLPIQRLEGKVVLITGGGGKVGVESAGRLLIEGCNVALIDIDQEALEAAIPVLKAAIPTGAPPESRLLNIVADATKEADVEACVKKVVQRFGQLDAAILNCCVRGESKSIFDITEDDFDRIMTTNAKSGAPLSSPTQLCSKYLHIISIPRRQILGSGHANHQPRRLHNNPLLHRRPARLPRPHLL